MIDRQQQIQRLLWKEVALKSRPVTIAFATASILMFFYHFELVHLKICVQLACVAAIIANVFRFSVATEIINSDELCGKKKNLLRLFIIINATAWSSMFALGALELEASSFHFAMLLCLFAATAAGTIVTLGYEKALFLPIQVIIMLPISVVLLYQYKEGINPKAHYLVIVFALYSLYQCKQFIDYRNHLLEKFNAQLDLEASIIELKKSKEALVNQTAKIVHASKIQALSEMAGGLAHEVNNSLMVIMGSTQQVQRELKKSEILQLNIDRKINQSTVAIMKIKSVIDGLKYFSLEMESTQKEEVSLEEVIHRTLSYTHELLKAHQINLEIGAIPKVKILCHPFQITQILFNLTKNAEDSMSNCVGEKWLKYDFILHREFVKIKISNNGTVITEENRTKLFQPFFSTKDVNQGTGLSLSISKGIAQDHKGDLYFEEDECTTFVLKLPIV